MEMSGQLHASAALPIGKELLVPVSGHKFNDCSIKQHDVKKYVGMEV
jgi:hypothetical protein